MTDVRKPIFDAVKQASGEPWNEMRIAVLDDCLDRLDVPRDDVAKPTPVMAFDGNLTIRVLQELVSHEAIVPEAYKDSVGVWTWSVGITSRSGHDVDRYKDNPQSLEHCLKVFAWLVKEEYAPAVLRAFAGHDLTEAQFAAALSFHYNTGAIMTASWVQLWKEGKPQSAQKAFMKWRKPPEIIKRRQAECDLFFGSKWSSNGKATIYPVRKPSYSPHWSKAKRVDITADLDKAVQ